jgi:hypothetical protein
MGTCLTFGLVTGARDVNAQAVSCGSTAAWTCTQGAIGTIFVPDRIITTSTGIRDCYFISVGGVYDAVKQSDDVMLKEVRNAALLVKATGGTVQIYHRGQVNCNDGPYPAIVGMALL